MQLNKLDLQRKTIASDLAEMKMQVDIDEMMLKRTLVSLNNERYLDSIGASTREKVREAELNYTVKQMQLEQLKRKFENKRVLHNRKFARWSWITRLPRGTWTCCSRHLGRLK